MSSSQNPSGIATEIFHAFFRHECMSRAASISFYALLAVIPLVMIMASIAGFFLGSSAEVIEQIVGGVMEVVPAGREIFLANLHSLLGQRSELSFYGTILLLFIATILVTNIEAALNTVFQSASSRNILHSHLLGVVLIFFISLIFFLPTMVQILAGLLQRYGFAFPFIDFFQAKVFFVLMAFLSYVVTTVVIPNNKVYLRYALVGGLLFAVGISVAKYIFRWYLLVALSRYNVIYGSLTAVVLSVLWIYYMAVVMLAASEVVAVLQVRRVFHRGK